MKRIVTLIVMFQWVALGYAQEKPRVFVTDSPSFSVQGGDDVNGSGGLNAHGTLLIKEFTKVCPQITITSNRSRADFFVLLNKDDGQTAFSSDNDFVLFNKEGDAIKTGSTRRFGNMVKDVCKLILENFKTAN